jgi:hypothetical protein
MGNLDSCQVATANCKGSKSTSPHRRVTLSTSAATVQTPATVEHPVSEGRDYRYASVLFHQVMQGETMRKQRHIGRCSTILGKDQP